MIYLTYAAIVSLFVDISPAIRFRAIGVNAAVIGAYFLLASRLGARPHAVWDVVRDWLPFALVLLCYREMGWFAPTEHTFELERSWIVWDRLLLNDWGARDVIESLGPLIPAYLEICYTLVYIFAPFAMAMIYIHGYRGEGSDRLLFIYLLGTLLSYALFPYFPSEPPRAVFPGEDVPRIDTVFRQFNWWILSGGGIHTSVFPSAHVSASFSAVFGMFLIMRRGRWAAWALTAVAVGIFWATIYGRYHYAVDSVAGLGVSLVALGVTLLVMRDQVQVEAPEPALAEAPD
ncbi:MAG: phosphatase PAP2 family protein [Acidobacteria bacterium]|nr:phosphatase PAP2 family protein [Acidobacteriota bacterium]